jgi:polyhydroxyalkanoate synthesis regulator phasin
MIEDMRKYVEAGLGSLTPSRAKDMARSLLQGQGTEQINRAAGTLMEWSRRSRERITELVQSEVKRQLRAVGVATRDDLDALRKRVRDLEKAPSAAAAPASRPSTRRPSAAKKSAAKKSTARKPTARKPTAKRSPVKRAGSSSSGASGSSSGSGSSS